MTGNFDEPALIRSAQQGDLAAFNLLVDHYQGQLFRVAYRMLGDVDSAADATQTAWLAAFHKFAQYRGGRLNSWLMHILVNVCYDQLRLQHRRPEVGLYPGNNDGEEFENPYWLLDTSPGVEESVDARQFDAAVQRALQRLPEVYRTMIVLVDIEGYGYEEAAAALRVPLGTVRSRVARGRMALRRQLEESGDIPHGWRQTSVSAADHCGAGCS
jgi:RNA polymerase sigma-70 factor (ECF subfamily)